MQFRLQSTFGHPGWFAEFVSVTIPFVFIPFLGKSRSIFWKSGLLVTLIVFAMALILAKSRAGWITYPLALVMCWFFVYLFSPANRDEDMSIKLKRSTWLKILISVPMTLVISFAIILKLFGTTGVSKSELEEAMGDQQVQVAKTVHGSLKHRFMNLFRAKDRLWIWEYGLDIGAESPIAGMGYEAFGWHRGILGEIPNSYLGRNNAPLLTASTSHNLFLQIFVSGGFFGLILWGSAIVYSIVILPL